MGLNYAFEIATPIVHLGDLVEAIACRLLPDERPERLRAAFAAHGVDLMQHLDDETTRMGSACLSFLFPVDPAVLEYSALRVAGDGRHGAVACVWSTIRCGERFALFQGTAATSEMSLLFQSSAAVRATFVEIGIAASAVAVLLDDETGLPIEVWPRAGRVALDAGVDVDAYCAAVVGGNIFEPPPS